MEDFRKLDYLSLVSKICTELNNHLGINDKDLAEFIIDLAGKNDTLESFKKALDENGAEFTESFISTLLRIIKVMKTKDAPMVNEDEDLEKNSIQDENDEKVAEAAISELETLNQHRKLYSSKGPLDRKRSRSLSPYHKRKHHSRSLSPRSRSRSPCSKRDHQHSLLNKHSYYKKHQEKPPEPVVNEVYCGKVTKIMQFGCFVQLEGFQKLWEGLVHISQLQQKGRVANVGDVVKRGQRVKVKVLSFTGQKTSLSMKDVNQETGEDLNPAITKTDSLQTLATKEILWNPDHPSNFPLISKVDSDVSTKRHSQCISSPERWEIKQIPNESIREILAYGNSIPSSTKRPRTIINKTYQHLPTLKRMRISWYDLGNSLFKT
ncbi:ATP-dependent RNA helicase DHX8 [Trichonephila clavipes]|nr:ATP-dependent RNA helicase DHX8 [Trichonephila clavipes]